MNWKDNFSTQAKQYAEYRPTYPKVLYDFLLQAVEAKELAWDCGTGNGQVASQLANYFNKVVATDPSQAQLVHAKSLINVEYRLATAEVSGLLNHSVDLITVAQAIHWFNFDKFYAEVRRVAREKAIIAIWGYGLLQITPSVDKILSHFYGKTLRNYWDAERKHLDNAYQTIPFPFQQLDMPRLQMEASWNLAELVGYLRTWSSVQKLMAMDHSDPLTTVVTELKSCWGDEAISQTVRWEIYLKVGKVFP
jgi:ubiquinone/menaquinone biosynthesis C-methylase UbiE